MTEKNVYNVILYFVSVFGNKISIKILPKISIIKTFQKVEWVFENGQKKMSKIEKSKKVLKKGIVLEVSEHNALIFSFWRQKCVTIFFFLFLEKNLF